MSPSASLAGRVAMVTGAGRGIGRAVALALADHGALVAALARSSTGIDTTVGAIEEAGGRAIAVRCDVVDPDAVRAAVEHITDELGPVDVLVNNAGSNVVFGPLWEVDLDQWWRDVTINLRGPALCAAAVLPEMIARGRGCIVNIASGSATRAFPYNSSYAAAKAALVRFSDSLAAETAAHGVSVFALNPGTVETDMCQGRIDSPAGQRWMPDVIGVLPEHYVPASVPADAVVFLAEGRADSLNGHWFEAGEDLEALVADAELIRSSGRLRLAAVR
jgi:NAD(P)-dependent dehydrogenase (short-subunit alcohol dehydrogenase family)